MAPYVTAAELQAEVTALAGVDDELLERYVAEFEGVAEDYLGVAFTPRTATDSFTATYGTYLRGFEHVPVRSVTSVTIDGETAEVGTYELTGSGLLYRAAGVGGRTVLITYEHGLDDPIPATLRRACLQYVRSVALADRNNVSREVISQSVDGMTLRYSTPDKKAGRPTGYIEVDRLLNNVPSWAGPKLAG
jgi:hypothetical protein